MKTTRPWTYIISTSEISIAEILDDEGGIVGQFQIAQAKKIVCAVNDLDKIRTILIEVSKWFTCFEKESCSYEFPIHAQIRTVLNETKVIK